MPYYWSTGDAVFDEGFTALIRFPKSQENWVFSVFLGMLYQAGIADSWLEFGETTPDEAAFIFQQIFDNYIEVDVWQPGDFKWTASPPSAAWLLCDGSTVLQSDYPDLYAAIATTFNTGGEPPGTFRLPDIRGRSIIMTNNSAGRAPSWANTLGGTGGESDHTLITSEIPSHTHTENPHSHTLIPHTHVESAAAPNVTTIGAGAPQPTAIPSPSITGSASDTMLDATATINSTGGDGSHNNMQPGIALSCWILAKV
jgi:microcystin-dependent protein